MPDLRDITITLACGRFVRRVTPEAMAERLGLNTVRPALLALLLRPGEPDAVPVGPSPTTGEPTEGERSLDPNVNVPNVNVPENILSVNVHVHERSLPKEHEAPSKSAHALAERLATELDDHGSLPWFRNVAGTLEEHVVLDALDRATRLPQHAIRRSRAAYFTGIVAPLLRRSESAATQQHEPRL